jgi:dCMP deaminase
MNWDKYYLDLCKTVATNSKCLSRKIGSIIVLDKSIISTGYNGPPRGVPPCDERWAKDKYLMKKWDEIMRGVTHGDIDFSKCPRYILGYKSGQGLDICIAGHAERNALVNAARHGISVKGATLYLDTVVCCKDCMIEIINAGIIEVVCTDLTYYDCQTEYLVKESGIKVRKYEL